MVNQIHKLLELRRSFATVVAGIFSIGFLSAGIIVGSLAGFTSAYAQEKPTVESIRWKSESQVRELLGDPNSIHGPIGTHASYTLWKYENVTVAFANNRAFHLFDKNSLKKFELNENR